MSIHPLAFWKMATYTFLVHQPLIRAIVHHSLSKYRGRELAIDLFGVQVGVLAIENEIISSLAEEYSCWFPEENEGETVPVLGSAFEEEFVRINAVLNSAADEWDKVKHQRGLTGIWEAQLPNDILRNGYYTNESKSERNQNRNRQLPVAVPYGVHGRIAESNVD
jgi:hypothetical protein